MDVKIKEPCKGNDFGAKTLSMDAQSLEADAIKKPVAKSASSVAASKLGSKV